MTARTYPCINHTVQRRIKKTVGCGRLTKREKEYEKGACTKKEPVRKTPTCNSRPGLAQKENGSLLGTSGTGTDPSTNFRCINHCGITLCHCTRYEKNVGAVLSKMTTTELTHAEKMKRRTYLRSTHFAAWRLNGPDGGSPQSLTWPSTGHAYSRRGLLPPTRAPGGPSRHRGTRTRSWARTPPTASGRRFCAVLTPPDKGSRS